MMEILIICLIGAIAGGIAGAIVDSDSGSLLVDIVIGIIGGYLGVRLFGTKLDFSGNYWVDKTITATAGAVILALVIKMARRLMNR
jgi:uncharacterized membrane protein YeaQ/YmgE (transglycosylase-associated protein family)